MVVTGASTHPGKFGFVSLHNLLAAGYAGDGVRHQPGRRGGARRPDGGRCRPISPTARRPRLRVHTGGGQPPTSSAPAPEGDPGRVPHVRRLRRGRGGGTGRTTASWSPSPTSWGMLIAGPNGQGVVSTPARLCAQIVAPYPPAGRIGVASQSGNFVSSFLNLARSTGVGISRAVSAGNAAAVSVADYLDFYADDPATSVGLAYIEGVTDGAALMSRLGGAAARKPLVVLEGRRDGGRGAGGGEPHRSAGRRRQVVRRSLPGARHHTRRDRRGGVRGGSHVRHATAAEGSRRGRAHHRRRMGRRHRRRHHRAIRDLRLLELPDDLLAAIDEHLPPRWSRNNPVDCAGGETRDTIPTCMRPDRRAPGGRRDRLPRPRHPVEPGAADARGSLLSRPRARADRRVPRTPGPALRRSTPPSSRTAPASRSCAQPSWRSPIRATPARRRCATPAGLPIPSGDRAVAALGHLYRYARHRARRAG